MLALRYTDLQTNNQCLVSTKNKVRALVLPRGCEAFFTGYIIRFSACKIASPSRRPSHDIQRSIGLSPLLVKTSAISLKLYNLKIQYDPRSQLELILWNSKARAEKWIPLLSRDFYCTSVLFCNFFAQYKTWGSFYCPN